jgi:hypothetical protein
MAKRVTRARKDPKGQCFVDGAGVHNHWDIGRGTANTGERRNSLRIFDVQLDDHHVELPFHERANRTAKRATALDGKTITKAVPKSCLGPGCLDFVMIYEKNP